MSLNGVSNTVFPNTLNGLDSLDLSSITINGQQLAALFVPYTGAQSNVDLNSKSLVGVNGITCAAVTTSGLVQSQNVTATALTTTNTLKINSVPAGTTAKYLATNATGEVIEADITTVYVPYTGATSHVNLNAKNLSNVLTYSGTNVQVTSTETTSLLATGTTQLYTLRITSIPAGTQTSILAVDSAGNVIVGTAPPSSQLNLTAAVSATVYYFPFIPSTSAGNQTVYVDTTVGSPSYLPSTQTLTVQNLAGNAATATKLYTTQTVVSSNYFFSFVPTNTAGNQDHYVAYPGTFGQDSYYSTGATLGDPGTFYFQRVNVAAAMQLPQDTTFPLISPGTAAFSLGIDSSNRIMKFTPGAPTVTATTANTGYYLAMCASNATGAQPLYVDGNGYITYNPSTYSLGVPNLTVSIGANIAAAVLTGTPTAPTAAPGTNTTQIATCQFVTTAIGSVSGYLPLSGGTMTGSIIYANTALTPITLSSANLTAYTYSIRDSFWTLPMLEFTTKTLSTFGSVSFGVPIVINNISSTNLMSLPYSSTTAYPKSISNTGGDIFMTFTNSTTSPAASGSVVFGSSIPVSINDTLSMNPASAGILCNTYKNISNATLQIQGFWSGANSGIRFDANSTNNSAAPALYANINSGGTTFYNGNTTQQERLTIINDRVKVSYVELAVRSQTAGQVRMISSETGYGTFWRNDNSEFYLLITANGDPYGSWNALRPFYISLASGRLFSTNGQSFSGGTDTDAITFQNGLGLTGVIGGGSPYGNVSTYSNSPTGWNGYDINRRWCLMGWQTNTEAGFHDSTYSWIWRTTVNNLIMDRPSIVFTNVPQQSYQAYQVLCGSNGNSLQWGVVYSSYYYNTSIDWKYGVNVASFYKASATSIVRCSGAASYYVSPGGMYLTQVNFYNVTAGISNPVNLYQFTNNASNHVSFPIMAQLAGLAVGNYIVYISHSGYSDGNDHLYILSEICPG